MKRRIFAAAFFVLSVAAIIVARPASAQDSPSPDLSGNDPHWVKATNVQCWVFLPYPSLGESEASFTWDGSCPEQVISGTGTLQYSVNNILGESETGTFEDGQQVSGTTTFYDSYGNKTSSQTGNVSNGLSYGSLSITYFDQSGDITETKVGESSNGAFHGRVKITYFDPSGHATKTYFGEYSHGAPNGRGTVTAFNSDGKISGSYTGIWSNGGLSSVISGDAPAFFGSRTQSLSGVPIPGPQLSDVVQNNPAAPATPPTPDLSGNDPHWIKAVDGKCWAYDANPTAGEILETGNSCGGQPVSGVTTVTWYIPGNDMYHAVDGTFVNGVAQGAVKIFFYRDTGGMVNDIETAQLEYDGRMANGLLSGDGTVTDQYTDKTGATEPSYEGIWSAGILRSVESGEAPSGLTSQKPNIPLFPGEQPSEFIQNDLQSQPAPAAPPPKVAQDSSQSSEFAQNDSQSQPASSAQTPEIPQDASQDNSGEAFVNTIDTVQCASPDQAIAEIQDARDQQNYRLSVSLINCLAQNGNVSAQLYMANHDLGQQDAKDALSLLQPLAQNGDVAAELTLGNMYDVPQGVPQDYAAALTWYQKAAAQGNATAEDQLGYMYHSGEGVTVDDAQAAAWYQKAAAQGNADAQAQVKLLAQSNQIADYQNAATQGDIKAEDALGDIYENGQGVTQDYGQAMSWYQKAAAQGDATAEVALGDLYNSGQGVTQDYGQAVGWYQKAADQGDAAGEDKLGDMYFEGDGVTKDDAQAAVWYQKAAAQGNADADAQLKIVAQDEEDRKNGTGAYAPQPTVIYRPAPIPFCAFFCGGHDDGD